MVDNRQSAIWGGLALIGFGIAIILAQWIGWEILWPIFTALGGLGFFAAYLGSGRKEVGFLFVGTAAILVALFLFGFTFGFWEWAEMAMLWPVFPIIVGLAGFVAYVASGLKEDGYVFLGVLAALVGLFFFGFTFGYWAWEEMANLWPVFFLIVGIALLVLVVVQRSKDVGAWAVAFAMLLVGVVGLAVAFGLMGAEVVQFWPLLLVALGLVGLFTGLLRILRRE